VFCKWGSNIHCSIPSNFNSMRASELPHVFIWIAKVTERRKTLI
jgi:hypothetical protein